MPEEQKNYNDVRVFGETPEDHLKRYTEADGWTFRLAPPMILKLHRYLVDMELPEDVQQSIIQILQAWKDAVAAMEIPTIQPETEPEA